MALERERLRALSLSDLIHKMGLVVHMKAVLFFYLKTGVKRVYPYGKLSNF